MGGAPCKIIIDHYAALNRAMQCMSNSVLLNQYAIVEPALVEEFLKSAEQAAKVAAKVEAAFREGKE